jgi:hypothetical protein
LNTTLFNNTAISYNKHQPAFNQAFHIPSLDKIKSRYTKKSIRSATPPNFSRENAYQDTIKITPQLISSKGKTQKNAYES